VRGRWRNWRNNATVRGELWRVLSYKCALLGIRTRQVEPRGTTHTCPHCHQQARTFASPAPADRKQALKWGPWLSCENPECLWNGARDYAASLNIARLGLALFLTARRRTPSQSNTPLFSERQASLVQQGWRDAAVAIAGDHTPPP
jgi:transposase